MERHDCVVDHPGVDGAAAWIEASVWQTVDVGTHSLFIGEVVDVGKNRDGRVASMDDTRMKYGGVKRGGH